MRRVRSTLESYTSLDSFNKSRMAQDSVNTEIRNKLTTLVTKAHLSDDLRETKLWFETINAENS